MPFANYKLPQAALSKSQKEAGSERRMPDRIMPAHFSHLQASSDRAQAATPGKSDRHPYARAAPITYGLTRLAFGLTMMSHGVPKLLRIPHGPIADPHAATANLIANGLGLPFPEVLAVLVALLETFGGLALALGLLTRLIAPLFAVQMIFISILLGPTWAWTERGIEYPVILGFVAAYFATRGDGHWSLGRLIRRVPPAT